MPLLDRRFYFTYKDGDRLYPQLYASASDPSKWVYHVSPARNALGHGKEAHDLSELKRHVLELGWRMRARSDDGRNGSYARYAGGVVAHADDPTATPPDISRAVARPRRMTTRLPVEAVGSRGGLKDGERDETGTKRRSGQGRYKLAVVDIWKSCSVTGCMNANLLVASHIVAHKDCLAHEQLDPYNGLLLTPNLDRLFDRGLISFDEAGYILIAARLDAETQKLFGVQAGMKLRFIPPATEPYLSRHRTAFRNRDAVRA